MYQWYRNFDVSNSQCVYRMWAERAEKLMSVCYSQDPNMTQSLIMKPSAEWSSVSAVTLAAEARNLKFVAHECVQTIVNKKWIGDMKTMTSRIKVRCSRMPNIWLCNADGVKVSLSFDCCLYIWLRIHLLHSFVICSSGCGC